MKKFGTIHMPVREQKLQRANSPIEFAKFLTVKLRRIIKGHSCSPIIIAFSVNLVCDNKQQGQGVC